MSCPCRKEAPKALRAHRAAVDGSLWTLYRRSMTWIVRIGLVAVAAVALAASITAVVVRQPLASAPVYTPAQFAALHLRSRLHIGQTLFIKGMLRDFGTFYGWRGSGAISQASPMGAIGVFVLYGPRSNISRLRGVPLIGRLVPPTADHPIMGQVAVFRVRVVQCAVFPVCSFRTPALQ